MEGVALVDAVLVGVLLSGVIAGLVKGLVRQAVELVGLVAAFLIAIYFAGWLAELLQEKASMPYSPSLVVAFAALFVGAIIGFHFVAIAVQKFVRMTFLGWVDRLCGALVGLILAMLLGSTLLSLALELPISSSARDTIESSQVGMFLRPMAPWLYNVVFGGGDVGAFQEVFKRGGHI